MNPILEAALFRHPAPRRSHTLRLPHLFRYLCSRRARWLRQSLNLLAWLAMVLLMSMALNGCNAVGKADPLAAEAQVQRQGDTLLIAPGSPLHAHLRVQPATPQPVADALSAVATLEAPPEAVVRVVPPLGGRIIQLHVGHGQRVKPGDRLVSLHAPELPALRGEFVKARAALHSAEQEYARQQTLFDADIAARRELEAAAMELEFARSEAHAAAAVLDQFGISVEAGHPSQYLLHAPIHGHILELDAAAGAYRDDGEPLLVIADLRTLWLSAHIPEREVARIAIGQHADIQFSAESAFSVTGVVQAIGDVIDPESRSVKVRIALDNPDGRLRPGMFANVHFQAPPREAVVIPASALVQGALQTLVWVQEKEGEFKSRPVVTGTSIGDALEIRTGLAAGEHIITNPVEFL